MQQSVLSTKRKYTWAKQGYKGGSVHFPIEWLELTFQGEMMQVLSFKNWEIKKGNWEAPYGRERETLS